MRQPTRVEVEDFLRRLLTEAAGLPAKDIHQTSAIDADLRMESVQFVEVQVAIEEEFDIQLDPIEVVERNEFGLIVEYIYGLVTAET